QLVDPVVDFAVVAVLSSRFAVAVLALLSALTVGIVVPPKPRHPSDVASVSSVRHGFLQGVEGVDHQAELVHQLLDSLSGRRVTIRPEALPLVSRRFVLACCGVTDRAAEDILATRSEGMLGLRMVARPLRIYDPGSLIVRVTSLARLFRRPTAQLAVGFRGAP